jgi:hypothetical protein
VFGSSQLELKIGQSRRRRIDGTQPPEFAAAAQYGDAESMAGRAAQGHEQDPTTFEIGDGVRSLRLAVFGQDQQRTVSLSIQLDPDGRPVGGFDALRLAVYERRRSGGRRRGRGHFDDLFDG